ncbi:ecto-ADP-ribosyltransferase 5-like [Neosynchiropus ocellatus]
MAVMLLLLTLGVWLGSTMDAARTGDLDLAPDSVDDMYNGCVPKMEKLAAEFLEKEQNENRDFKMAWDKAQQKFSPESGESDLETRQKMAVYAYTLDEPPLYADFNQAVRTARPSYRTTFQYHALHFYLTTAVQRLKREQGTGCRTVYRRVEFIYPRDVVKKRFRFGSFASSSMDDYLGEEFGRTCFKIKTCFGANISKYSEIEEERELLIPPYEVFKVTAVIKNPRRTCDVEYQVNSTGPPESKLNCALVNKGGSRPSQMNGL